MYYVAVDDDGRKISPPIMASQVLNRPTYAQLEKEFDQISLGHDERIRAVQSGIDQMLFQRPANIRELADDLWTRSVEIVIPGRKHGDPHNFIYVDHSYKITVEGHKLTSAYTAESLQHTLSKANTRASDRSLQSELSFVMAEQGLRAAGFNSRVPQMLSSVFSSLPEQREQQLDQSLGQRYRR